uniref:Uncharacterized protein n=1 Tax=Clytia hemisphaerica TaxID=252671 RepID=A0A7M5X814_9CNID
MKIDNTCINRLVYDFEDRPTILLYVLEREKDHSIVEYLVNHEYCDVNVTDWRGQSPFYFAVQFENIPAVKCLLKRDPSVINKTTYHSSPLHRAARSGNVDLVKILLEQDNIESSHRGQMMEKPFRRPPSAGNGLGVPGKFQKVCSWKCIAVPWKNFESSVTILQLEIHTCSRLILQLVEF